jgi:hypothetical protein
MLQTFETLGAHDILLIIWSFRAPEPDLLEVPALSSSSGTLATETAFSGAIRTALMAWWRRFHMMPWASALLVDEFMAPAPDQIDKSIIELLRITLSWINLIAKHCFACFSFAASRCRAKQEDCASTAPALAAKVAVIGSNDTRMQCALIAVLKDGTCETNG